MSQNLPPWRKELQPASFRGKPFGVKRAEELRASDPGFRAATDALLHTLAALQRAGQQPQVPKALLDEETPVHQQELEAQAQTIVRAMINAAKADGRIDETEISKIIGKLDDDGLTEAEKNFFLAEANKPMDLQGIINEAASSQELATEVYAASLLAIEVDTPAEQQYMAQLASGLALPQEAVAHIHETLGLRVA